tara:strand:- start:414 stop:554 length:141 start_codon:yes stop_codon:yes gene_type:complete
VVDQVVKVHIMELQADLAEVEVMDLLQEQEIIIVDQQLWDKETLLQ